MKSFDTVPGTFAYDLSFLNQFKQTLVLSDTDGKSQLIIVPGWQARVMTSTANGDSGFSYGWINYKLIESGVPTEHMNAFGGEERIWLGPEGGPFSIYFNRGRKQEFSNWFVPAELDTLPFDLVSAEEDRAVFSKNFTLANYAGNQLDIGIERTIELIGQQKIDSLLGVKIPENVNRMAYQSDNILINRGKTEWNKSTGMLSVWMLSMFNPSPGITIFIPYDTKTEKGIPVLNDDYFGKIPADRLKTDNSFVWFKADGKYRSKLGLPPQRIKGWAASYDSVNNVLTLLWTAMPKQGDLFVNSKWGEQKDPFTGDAINAYNDGPVDDGTQMGPFYELESSSPAANLKPGENIRHIQRIFHFEGKPEELEVITMGLFGLGIGEIADKF
jgi:hypothetical protein